MNEEKKGILCAACNERFYYRDELVFFLGDVVIHFIDEQYPDWSKAVCLTCADEQGWI